MSCSIIAAPVSAIAQPRAYLAAGVLASPVRDYLRDPLGAFQNVLAHLRDLPLSRGPIVGPILAVAITAAVVARRRWRRRYHENPRRA